MPGWKNDANTWGWLAIALHWLVAIAVLALYLLGDYMVDLSYYDAWYHRAPFWHRSFGLFLCALVLARLLLRILGNAPQALQSHQPWERCVAKWVHRALYLNLFVIFMSGYFISTADGNGISFFGLFDIPSLINSLENLEDRAGEVHAFATNLLVFLVGLHALAALKHHFTDRDKTLLRMLGR